MVPPRISRTPCSTTPWLRVVVERFEARGGAKYFSSSDLRASSGGAGRPDRRYAGKAARRRDQTNIRPDLQRAGSFHRRRRRWFGAPTTRGAPPFSASDLANASVTFR